MQTDLRHRQRGVALLTVLLITALVSILAVSMIDRHRLAIARTQQLVGHQQAFAYALGAERHARSLLRADREEDSNDPPIDSRADRWAEIKEPFEVPFGKIEIHVRDLSGLLNLNNTGDLASRDRLRRLLTALAVDAALADAIGDWVDGDEELSGTGGAEDGTYLLKEPPYRAGNGPFASVSELRLLPEVDEETYRRLLPFVATLPSGVRRINVNTAPGPVLAALAPGMTPEAAGAYAFPTEPYAQPGELVGQEAGFAPEQGMIAVASRFFEIIVRAEFGGQTVTLRSRVYRDPETAQTTVLSRDLGQRFATWVADTDPVALEEDQ